jgi:uncharacterized membrane protein
MSGLCLALLAIRYFAVGEYSYGFIPWNLALAWVALASGWVLARRLKGPIDWEVIVIVILWLIFLPNAWYVLTDFVHIYPDEGISLIYDIVLMTSLTIAGFTAGFCSLFLVHKALIKRTSQKTAHYLIGGVLLLSSFGIYLGRDLRWNTWDLISNPAGLILDVSDRLIDPLGHPRFITMTGLFFILLGTIYFCIWHIAKELQAKNKT